MADIFISYSQRDRNRVQPLVDALSSEGYQVFWDLEIRAGESFDELIESTLESVSCVVGVWSRDSVKSQWVRAESAWAKDRGKFVSVRIDDDAELPLKFYHVHTAKLVGWSGYRNAAEFRSLVRDIEALTAAPTRKPLSSFRDRLRDGGEGPEMVVIPAGRFWMGSPEGEPGRSQDEGPRHQVEIPRPFALGKYPVTFAGYDRFAEATRRTKSTAPALRFSTLAFGRGTLPAFESEKPNDSGFGRGTRPVINVDWDDAVAYADWLSEQSGRRYRLPSEAEWEYACRAGTQTKWFFGDKESELGEYAWYTKNSGMETHPAGEKKPNPWGLYDVHGNVSEWVRDCWNRSYAGAPVDGSAWEEQREGDIRRRVVRGGYRDDKPDNLRSARRYRYDAGIRLRDIGFRLARDL